MVDLLCTKRVVKGKVVDVNNLRACFMADLMGQEYGQVRDLANNVTQSFHSRTMVSYGAVGPR